MKTADNKFLMQRFVFSDGESVFLNMFYNEKIFRQDYMFYTPATGTIIFPAQYISGKFSKTGCHITIYTITGIENTLESDRVMTISNKESKKGTIQEVLSDLPIEIKIQINNLINKNLKK